MPISFSSNFSQDLPYSRIWESKAFFIVYLFQGPLINRLSWTLPILTQLGPKPSWLYFHLFLGHPGPKYVCLYILLKFHKIKHTHISRKDGVSRRSPCNTIQNVSKCYSATLGKITKNDIMPRKSVIRKCAYVGYYSYFLVPLLDH